MEMTAVLGGLKWLNSLPEEDVPKNIEIISDSQYVIYSITKNWKKATNKDIWFNLYDEHKKLKDLGIRLKYSWIKGHAGTQWNEHVDKLANSEYKKLL